MDGPKLSYKRLIEKIQQVENVVTWFSIIFWKNLKIKLVRPLRNLQKQKFPFEYIFTPQQMWKSRRLNWLSAGCLVCWWSWVWVQTPWLAFLEDFFFIIGEKGWAHPKVFRLPHPSMTKCLAFRILGYRKGLYNWFLQWNKRFTVREIFFATWKSAGFFLQFLVQKWTKKESTPNFFELWGFVLMSQMILKKKETFFSPKMWLETGFFRFGGLTPL